MLSPDERSLLLRIARESIATEFQGRELQAPPDLSEALRRPAGAFVTLKKDGHLRGCIGSVVAVVALHQSVAENARNAAFHDPRFPPLAENEVSEVSLEISVMGPLEQVEDVSLIETGRDGLIVRQGRFTGLLLPQVALEEGWDRETFLSYTCMKAGLPRNAWRDGECLIERFSAEVFGERSEWSD